MKKNQEPPPPGSPGATWFLHQVSHKNAWKKRKIDTQVKTSAKIGEIEFDWAPHFPTFALAYSCGSGQYIQTFIPFFRQLYCVSEGNSGKERQIVQSSEQCHNWIIGQFTKRKSEHVAAAAAACRCSGGGGRRDVGRGPKRESIRGLHCGGRRRRRRG